MTLKRYLDQKKISVEDFAAKVGVHNTTLYRYLNGECAPNSHTIKAIVEATKGQVTADDLLGKVKEAS